MKQPRKRCALKKSRTEAIKVPSKFSKNRISRNFSNSIKIGDQTEIVVNDENTTNIGNNCSKIVPGEQWRDLTAIVADTDFDSKHPSIQKKSTSCLYLAYVLAI